MSELPEKRSEISEMTSIAFAQHALRERVAPPSVGSVKARLRYAVTAMNRRNWSANRVKDVWYADPRISLSADEIRDLEEITGLRYGRRELKELDQLISRADALLEGTNEDFYRPFVDAFRQALRAMAGAGAGR